MESKPSRSSGVNGTIWPLNETALCPTPNEKATDRINPQ